MTSLRTPSLVAALLTLALSPMAPAAAGPSAETSWTSADGVTIWARFAGIQRDRILLVRGGKSFRVPMSRLSPESVAKAERLIASQSESTLPVFAGPEDPSRSALALPARPSISTPHTAGRDRHGLPLYPFSARHRIVRTTAYTCDEADHLIYGNRSAAGSPLRAVGEIRSAAADWSVYPLGTTFSIKGLPGVYVVDDYGSALIGTGTLDIYQPDRRSMARWGCRSVEVTVLRWGSLVRSAEILRGRQGFWHCREMLAAILRQRVTTLACR